MQRSEHLLSWQCAYPPIHYDPCMLHSRIRIVFMFIRYVFKVAKKNGNVMLQAVLDVFNRHIINYKVQELRGASFDQALRSLNGNESRKFADVVIPDIIDVIFPGQPERQAYCKEIFVKWASIDSTVSKKHCKQIDCGRSGEFRQEVEFIRNSIFNVGRRQRALFSSIFPSHCPGAYLTNVSYTSEQIWNNSCAF